MDDPADSPLCQAFLTDLQHMLGEDLLGVYLYGALTFPDSSEHVQDIDFHVWVRRPFGDRERVEVDALHRSLAQRFPPLGAELDGYYVTIEDARRTSSVPTQMWPRWRTPADVAWALHCAHIHAGRVITLHGPDPRTLYPVPAWPEIEAALWAEVAFVDRVLSEAPAYAVLNACRLLYSFRTRDVVISKRAAASWALDTLSEPLRPTIEAALRAYSGEDSEQDGCAVAKRAAEFVQTLWHMITAARAMGEVLPE